MGRTDVLKMSTSLPLLEAIAVDEEVVYPADE